MGTTRHLARLRPEGLARLGIIQKKIASVLKIEIDDETFDKLVHNSKENSKASLDNILYLLTLTLPCIIQKKIASQLHSISITFNHREADA